MRLPPDLRNLLAHAPWVEVPPETEEAEREWLVANGIGGYASGTLSGRCSRRYHGLLTAALPAPHGRVVVLSHLGERLSVGDATFDLAAEGSAPFPSARFRLEAGLPVWRYEAAGAVVEKRVLLPHRQNTVAVLWTLLRGPSATLTLSPSLRFRPHREPVEVAGPHGYDLHGRAGRYEVCVCGERLPPLRLALRPGVPALEPEERVRTTHYAEEERRGYRGAGELWVAARFELPLGEGETVTIRASTESWETMEAVAPEELVALELERRHELLGRADPGLTRGAGRALVLASDAFVISPRGRPADAARARAAGLGPRSVVAGYHWFNDWARDAMISLEGLTLLTGRELEARAVLRTFARHVRDGLLPSRFPEGQDEGVYHHADGTLWFFHALDRYLARTGDRVTLEALLPTLCGIVDAHFAGTRFGIRVDPRDGLLTQGTPDYPLTWMDAKVDGWVVTPRRGKAVEINALWYNALRLLSRWTEGPLRARYAGDAERARASFGARFPLADGWLYDVVDGEEGDDPALRPNQLLAISLPEPVLDRSHWPSVVEACQDRLLTPFGLRTLAPGSSGYRSRYFGDVRSRDAAYHQGTVWPWLLGPFVDAWLAVNPDDLAGARRFLEPLEAHAEETGSVAEIFDAEPPFVARGCIAQAWSVAELLRARARTEAR